MVSPTPPVLKVPSVDTLPRLFLIINKNERIFLLPLTTNLVEEASRNSRKKPPYLLDEHFPPGSIKLKKL